MIFLLQQLAPWTLAAAALGLVFGLLAGGGTRRRGEAFFALVLLLAAGAAADALGLAPGRYGLWLEIGLTIFGCLRFGEWLGASDPVPGCRPPPGQRRTGSARRVRRSLRPRPLSPPRRPPSPPMRRRRRSRRWRLQPRRPRRRTPRGRKRRRAKPRRPRRKRLRRRSPPNRPRTGRRPRRRRLSRRSSASTAGRRGSCAPRA